MQKTNETIQLVHSDAEQGGTVMFRRQRIRIFFPTVLSVFMSFMVIGFFTNEASTTEKQLHHVGLPQVFAYGNHWDIGFTIGSTFKSQVHQRLQNLPEVQSLKTWIEESPDAQEIFQKFVKINREFYPEYFIELEAIATGSSVLLDDLLILNLRNELMSAKVELEDHEQAPFQETGGCFDCMMVDAYGNPFLGHNEDGDVASRGTAFLLWGKISGKSVREEISFVSLVYPGELPTNAFFVNQFRLACSMDGLYPLNSIVGGIGRNFISRDLIAAKNIEEAIQRIGVKHQATGHNYNFISPASNLKETSESSTSWNVTTVETSPNILDPEGVPLMSVYDLARPLNHSQSFYFHANNYRRLKVAESSTTVYGSEVRLAAAQQLGAPTSWEDMRKVLGDTSDDYNPIYRTAKNHDTGYTLMTVLFNMIEDRLDIFLENPDPQKGSEKASFTIGLFF